jgi:hypothetical protein
MLNPEACDGPAIYVKHFCAKVMWYGSIKKMYQLLRGDFEIRNSTTCMMEADFLGGHARLPRPPVSASRHTQPWEFQLSALNASLSPLCRFEGERWVGQSQDMVCEPIFLDGEGCSDKCASSHIKRIVCLMKRKKYCCARNSFRSIGLRIETRGRCAVLVALCHRKTAVENHGT